MNVRPRLLVKVNRQRERVRKMGSEREKETRIHMRILGGINTNNQKQCGS